MWSISHQNLSEGRIDFIQLYGASWEVTQENNSRAQEYKEEQ